MSNKIYADNSLYTFLRYFVDFFVHRSYKRNVIRGLENIPQDGQVIFAPNHCNTLMDALVVLSSRREKTVFGARADIFKKAAIARIMHFLRILPIARTRDGLRSVTQNYETMDKIVETLENNVKFCMYCEGTHRMKHSLLSIKKGIFRTAAKAHERFGTEQKLYIVPVGLEYGDYVRYRSTSIVNFGKAINISQWFEEHKEVGEAEAFKQFSELLSGKMAELITYIKDDENYDATWILTKTASAGICNPVARLESNKAAIERIEKALELHPEETAVLFEKAQEFENARSAAGISFLSFNRSCFMVLLKTLGALAFLPYFLWCAIMSSPMWLAVTFLCKKVFKDKAFWNTGRFGVNFAMTPLMLIIWALVFFLCFEPLHALIILLLTLPAYAVSFQFKEYLRVLCSDWKLMFNKKLRREFEALRQDIDKL